MQVPSQGLQLAAVTRVGDDVLGFARVGLQVEQLARPVFGALDIFHVLGAHAAQVRAEVDAVQVLLEDLILTAVNSALSSAKEMSNAEMGKVTAGMNLPGLM